MNSAVNCKCNLPMWPHPFQGLGSFTLLSFTPNLAPSYRDLKDPTTRQNLRTHPDRFLNSSWHCVICDILSFCMWTHVARRMILDSWLTVFVFVFFFVYLFVWRFRSFGYPGPGLLADRRWPNPQNTLLPSFQHFLHTWYNIEISYKYDLYMRNRARRQVFVSCQSN